MIWNSNNHHDFPSSRSHVRKTNVFFDGFGILSNADNILAIRQVSKVLRTAMAVAHFAFAAGG